MFIEPTRRLTFAPPFTYDARYGASLVAVLLGSYLLLNTSVSQIAVALAGLGAMPQTVTALLVTQLVFAGLVLLAGILIHPATPARRLAAGAVVLVGLILWVVLSGVRVTGAVRLPPLSIVILAPSFVITLLAVAAWLIVRERHGCQLPAVDPHPCRGIHPLRARHGRGRLRHERARGHADCGGARHRHRLAGPCDHCGPLARRRHRSGPRRWPRPTSCPGSRRPQRRRRPRPGRGSGLGAVGMRSSPSS